LIETRAINALSTLGVSQCNQAWQFPLRQAGLKMPASSVVDGWNVVHQGCGIEQLEEYVTLRIRQWRPELLLTRAASPNNEDPLGLLIGQIVTTATERAADPNAYPDHARILGLQPWKARKVVASTTDGSGTMHLETSRLATQLGRSLRDHSLSARALISNEWIAAPTRVGFELLLTDAPRSVAARDLTSGLVVAHGSDARRPEGSPAPVSLASLRKSTQQQELVETLLVHAGSDHDSHVDLTGQLDSLTRDVSARRGGELLYQLAQNYRELGRYELAANTLQRLAANYPQHELAEAAFVWLVGYHSGSEAQHAFVTESVSKDESRNRASFAASFNEALPPGTQRKAIATRYDSRVQRAGFDSVVPSTRLSLSEVATAIQRTRLDLFAEPSVRLAVASAHRRAGQLHQARQLYQQIANGQPLGAWRQTARAELWFESGRGRCPKPLLICTSHETKPLLDAKLDDPLWQSAAKFDLRSQLDDDEGWPASIMLAHDDDYLYVAAVCQNAPSVEYTTSNEPRSRDPDLSNQDRVEVLIDANRDYNSFYRLTVDHRGWTGEACWGDTRWNPEWFVAATSDDRSWTIEAAIPLTGLAEKEEIAGATWAVGVQRVVPAVGFQSWTQPASATGQPEGFGYVTIE
jgi:tetratricopeptide (TPR) repeat protein